VPGEEAGTTLLYIALAKIDGESLAELLAKGPLDVDRGLDIMLEVLVGLSSAHAQGVIHRDLKPANVLLENGKKVTVVDFGMSKIITGSGLGTTNLTTHNMVFGTPEYMSPEQARGDELDARCDVYAAGVIVYEILTGSPPFTGPSPLVVLTAHLTSDLEPPRKRPSAASRVTPALDAVVVHALARDRDARYASATALAAAIAHARSAPHDVASVRPSAFSTSPPGTDAFAATIPASLDANDDIATAPTIVSDRRPILGSSSPTPRPSARPSRPPPSSVSKPPSVFSRAPQSDVESSTRTWVLLWVVVGLASIATGIYFALRASN
jgi:eukaryotic-like serine/threonine-protein kinase